MEILFYEMAHAPAKKIEMKSAVPLKYFASGQATGNTLAVWPQIKNLRKKPKVLFMVWLKLSL